MKRFCELYISKVGLIGALYCIIPITAWFIVVFLTMPFREVYLLRLALSCTIGAYIAARLNRAGLDAWLKKHQSRKNGATVLDGVIIGSLVGLGLSLLPPLTALIYTNHPREAVLFIAAAWITGLILGGAIGGYLASVGVRYLEPGKPVVF